MSALGQPWGISRRGDQFRSCLTPLSRFTFAERMKTFTTTIYDLRARHFIHFLGVALGLFLTLGYIYALYHNGSSMVEWKEYKGLITFTLMMFFGLLLIIPKRIIKKRKTRRVLFYAATIVFTLHMISVILQYPEWNWFYAAIDSSMIIVATIQLPLISPKSEPVAVVNASAAAGKSENHLHN